MVRDDHKAIDALCQAGVLQEITGKRRDRVYAYRRYLDVLGRDVIETTEHVGE
jgi:hypothetical protein